MSILFWSTRGMGNNSAFKCKHYTETWDYPRQRMKALFTSCVPTDFVYLQPGHRQQQRQTHFSISLKVKPRGEEQSPSLFPHMTSRFIIFFATGLLRWNGRMTRRTNAKWPSSEFGAEAQSKAAAVGQGYVAMKAICLIVVLQATCEQIEGWFVLNSKRIIQILSNNSSRLQVHGNEH